MKILTLIFLFCTLLVKGQGINLELNTGLGFYNLGDIRSFQDATISAMDISGIKAVESFPDNQYYSVSLNCMINELSKIGIEFSYFSTGGRNHLADYSGKYKLDMLLNGYQIGAKYHDFMYKRNRFKVGFQLAGGMIFSELEVDEELIVFEEEIVDEGFVLESATWYVEPMLKASYDIVNGVAIHIGSGYNFNFKDSFESNGRTTDITVDWSGMRFLVGMDFSLRFRKKS